MCTSELSGFFHYKYSTSTDNNHDMNNNDDGNYDKGNRNNNGKDNNIN